MAGATRNRTRNTNINIDTAVGASGNVESGHAPTPQGHRFHVRDDAARLSEDFQPMHFNDETSLHEQLEQAASEIDALGLHVKDTISTINQLEGLGLQRLKIPLPKIIVLGEQSTGKSSVIEAISGIKTPRSTGTCTRCPIFVRIETPPDPHAKWTARVSLRLNYGWDGKNGRGSGRRFPGWFPQEPKTADFMSADDPAQLEFVIGRAQLATVSPLINHVEFTNASISHLNDAHQCRFSPNVVCISISHPGSSALSFYDLPGIIGQAENASDVKFVRDLVVEYIKDPEALVLVTCSMENDIANSMAGGIARELKATHRCIGVLTKPDRITEAARKDVLYDIFEQKKFSFGYGYFVVRNPDQEQLNDNVTRNDARNQEKQFFTYEKPFTTTFRKYESRFGSYNLQTFLSGKLAEQITKKLPIIQEEINSRLFGIEARLKQYPEPPSHNALRIIFDLVLAFAQNVRQEIEGEFPYKAWRNSWKTLQRDLFDSLLSLKPTMATSGKRDKDIYLTSLRPNFTSPSGSSACKPLVVDDEEVDEEADDERNGNVDMSHTPETPSKKRKVEAENTPGPSPLKSSVERTNNDNNGGGSVPGYSNMRTKFQLDEVAQHLEEMSQSRVPGRIEHRVTDALMLKTLENWQMPINEFFNRLDGSLRAQVKVLFNNCFDKWKGTALYQTAWKVVEEVLDLNLHQQRQTMASESLADEKVAPYIFHRDIFSKDKEAVLEHYRQARFKARLNTYKRERIQRVEKPLSSIEEARLKRDEKFMALLYEEPYSTELNVVAEITTYYMIAARRFHDSICMRIESKFFKQLRFQLRDELENGLGIHDGIEAHHNAVMLLAEQSERERQRQELLAQRNALLQGKQVLHDLQQKRYGDDVHPQASSSTTVPDMNQNSFRPPSPTVEEVDEEI